MWGFCQLWVTYENISKINCVASITIKQGNIVPSLTHNSLPLSASLPLCFPSSSSVCRRCGGILWADWAALLSSTCLLNDSNYFPGLQATHACFISTSTSPICLHGDAWHTPCWWDEKKNTAKHFISLHTFLWVPTGFSSLGSFTEGPRSFMIPQGFCRDWQMLLGWSHDGLDTDKDT